MKTESASVDHFAGLQEIADTITLLLDACRLHDAYMAVNYSGPESNALHPQAAANWRLMRAAIAKAERGL